MVIHVPTQIKVELSKDDVNNIVNKYLDELMGEYWVSEGRLMTEHATSHRFNAEVKPDEIRPAGRYRTLMAVAELQSALKDWRP